MSAFVALTEKSLQFTIRKISLQDREHYAADYTARSITNRIPTLQHDDFCLSESSAIDEYLEERFPAPRYAAIYPRDLQQRARARQIQAWLRSDFMPIRQERSTEIVFLNKRGAPLTPAAQESAARLYAAVDSLLKDDAEYLFGNWCITDTDLALMLNRLIMNGDPVPTKLAAYAHKQWSRPSVKLWQEQHRTL